MHRNALKVLIVGSTHGVYGGIEVFMLALAEYLNRQPGITCKVVFKIVKGYSLQNSLRELISQSDIAAEVTTRGPLQLFPYILWADVIHAQNFPPDALYPGFLLGKTVVSTQHNWKRTQLGPHQLLWNISHRLLDYTTYNSEFVSRTWENGNTGSHKSSVIPTISRFPEETPDYSSPRKGFCFISRWIENKGVELLIEAYSKTSFDRGKHPLRMMGTGPLFEQIHEKLKKAPVEGLEILGRVEEKTKFEVIRSSAWMVTPPQCYEDMGLTPIEARMLGVPTIASNIGGVPESAGEFALFFEPGNVQSLTKQLEQAARETPERYLERCKGCYESLQHYLKPLDIYPGIYRRFTPYRLEV